MDFRMFFFFFSLKRDSSIKKCKAHKNKLTDFLRQFKATKISRESKTRQQFWDRKMIPKPYQ